MKRRVVLFVMAMATLGLAAPAMASAAPVLTMPATTLVPTGTLITASSSNFAFTKEGRTLGCEKNVELRGKVSENSVASGVHVISTGVSTTNRCDWPGLSLPYEDITLGELVIKEAGKGTATFSLKIPIEGTGCTWTAKSAPFTYTAGTSSIKFSKVTLQPFPMACTQVVIDADFTLETTAPGSGPVLID